MFFNFRQRRVLLEHFAAKGRRDAPCTARKTHWSLAACIEQQPEACANSAGHPTFVKPSLSLAPGAYRERQGWYHGHYPAWGTHLSLMVCSVRPPDSCAHLAVCPACNKSLGTGNLAHTRAKRERGRWHAQWTTGRARESGNLGHTRTEQKRMLPWVLPGTTGTGSPLQGGHI